MSTKYLLAAFGLALAKAAEVLIEHSEAVGEIEGEVLTSTVEETTPPQITPQQIAAQQAGTAELDVEGLPWDARIHAGTKTKTQKNAWTKRKHVDDATFNSVIAELRKSFPAPQVSTTVTPPVTTAPVVGLPVINVAAKTPYTEFVDWLAKNTGDGKALSSEWVSSVFAQNNVTLADLANKHDMAAEFLKGFRGVLAQMNIAEVA